MAGVYEEYFQSPKFGPNWMHDAVGDTYWRSIGRVVDNQLDRARAGLRARLPDDAAAMGMADALELQGRDRLLPRGGSSPGAGDETLADWATRLKGAWETWGAAGGAAGLLTELAVQGFPTGETGASIFNHIGRRYYLDEGELVVSNPCMASFTRTDKTGVIPDPLLTGFSLDARNQFYSRFCILFLQDVPELTNEPGNAAKAILNQSVERWRQGGASYAGAAVVPVAAEAKVLGWPPEMKYGDEGLVFGDNGARFIDPR